MNPMRTVSLWTGLLCLAVLSGCAAIPGANDDLSRRVDYLRQDVENLTAQQKALTDEVIKLRDELKPLQTAAPMPDKPGTLEVKNLATDSASLYKEAFDLMQQDKFAEAEAKFADFVSRFPQSDLADNAQYWIGECLYSEKNYKDAEAAFEAVSNHFPFGNKVPDALYKQAVCERLAGDEPAAKTTFQKLIDNFPDSEAATKAKAALKESSEK
jgi:tol-pal system protein YbgF